jgi:hypothetical protein
MLTPSVLCWERNAQLPARLGGIRVPCSVPLVVLSAPGTRRRPPSPWLWREPAPTEISPADCGTHKSDLAAPGPARAATRYDAGARIAGRCTPNGAPREPWPGSGLINTARRRRRGGLRVRGGRLRHTPSPSFCFTQAVGACRVLTDQRLFPGAPAAACAHPGCAARSPAHPAPVRG